MNDYFGWLVKYLVIPGVEQGLTRVGDLQPALVLHVTHPVHQTKLTHNPPSSCNIVLCGARMLQHCVTSLERCSEPLPHSFYILPRAFFYWNVKSQYGTKCINRQQFRLSIQDTEEVLYVFLLLSICLFRQSYSFSDRVELWGWTRLARLMAWPDTVWMRDWSLEEPLALRIKQNFFQNGRSMVIMWRTAW